MLNYKKRTLMQIKCVTFLAHIAVMVLCISVGYANLQLLTQDLNKSCRLTSYKKWANCAANMDYIISIIMAAAEVAVQIQMNTSSSEKPKHMMRIET